MSGLLDDPNTWAADILRRAWRAIPGRQAHAGSMAYAALQHLRGETPRATWSPAEIESYLRARARWYARLGLEDEATNQQQAAKTGR